jgi:hypothetical protein
MAGDQVFRPIDPRDTAGVLDARHALAKRPLSASRQDDLRFIRCGHRGRGVLVATQES